MRCSIIERRIDLGYTPRHTKKDRVKGVSPIRYAGRPTRTLYRLLLGTPRAIAHSLAVTRFEGG